MLAVIILLYIFYKSPIKCVTLVFIWYPTLKLLPICRGVNVTTIFAYLLFFYALYSRGKKSFVSFPFLLPFVLSIGSYLISAVIGYKIAFSVGKWLEQYFLVLAIWSLFKPIGSFCNFCIYNFIAYLLILDVYAVFESITVTNPFISYINSYVYIPQQASNYVRYGLFRSQSLTIWTDVMAIISSSGAVFLLFAFFKNLVKPNFVLYFTWVLSASAVFISGCRSIILATFFSLGGIIKNLFSIKYVFIVGCLVSSLLFIFSDFFSQVLESFVHSDEAGGSDMEMRAVQFAVMFQYWKNAPIFGNGLDYTDFLIDQKVGLLGAESVIFRLLLDRGIVGFLLYVFLFVYSIVKLYKMNRIELSSIFIGYFVGRLFTALYGIDEAYMFGYVVLMLKMLETKKIQMLKEYVEAKCFCKSEIESYEEKERMERQNEKIK